MQAIRTEHQSFRTSKKCKEWLKQTALERHCTVADVLNELIEKCMKGEGKTWVKF